MRGVADAEERDRLSVFEDRQPIAHVSAYDQLKIADVFPAESSFSSPSRACCVGGFMTVGGSRRFLRHAPAAAVTPTGDPCVLLLR
jgi:hypothetical protein